MFELKLKKESLFVNVLEAILDLTNVANFDCSSTGLKVQAVDPEEAVIIALLFPADFQHYHCDEDISLGIAIDAMVKVIRYADKDDTITIKFGDENFDTIALSLESPKENKTTANAWWLDLLLVEANSLRTEILEWQVSEPNYQTFVQMPSAEFMRVCKCLSCIGGNGHISLTEESLKFFALGISGCANIEYMQRYTIQAPISVTLDLKYMNSFAKASTLSNQVDINFSTTQPLMFQCKIGQTGYIRYFIADEIEIEEENCKKRKRSERNNKDEGSAKEKERSRESEYEESEDERSKESEDERSKADGKEMKQSEDERSKESEDERSKERDGKEKEAKISKRTKMTRRGRESKRDRRGKK